MARLEASEAERQLVAAAERHSEVVAAVAVAGRSDHSQRSAAAALARGVQLLTFTVTRAAASGVERGRIAELIGGDAALVDDVLDRGPDTSVIERLTPVVVDRREVVKATASFDASVRVGAVVQAIMADIEDRSWSPASTELDDLAERLSDVWRLWRQDLGRRDA
ncbi:MAG TPA: hypothetical protein VFZ00_32005 [Solirubrobacter sp.]|nr:hypothetical protein [Solirubrobacter sp.]